jgi:hypothetical protein
LSALFPYKKLRLADAKTLKSTLEPIGSALVSVKENLVDIAWGSARPLHPNNPAYPLDVKFAGADVPPPCS